MIFRLFGKPKKVVAPTVQHRTDLPGRPIGHRDDVVGRTGLPPSYAPDIALQIDNRTIKGNRTIDGYFVTAVECDHPLTPWRFKAIPIGNRTFVPI